MKIFISLILLLTGITAINHPEPSEKNISQQSPENILSQMIGEWDISYRLRMAPSQEFMKGKGSATFTEFHLPTQVKEEFSLGRAGGTAFINYSKAHDRYEFFQIDRMASSSIYLLGTYSKEQNRINFSSIENLPQWGKTPELDIRWEYQFYDDGSFKKEMYMRGSDGEYFLQSDYHYTQKNN